LRVFVVFEGIDGGGKTTLSNLVAKRLRARGLTVEHVREGGKFASAVTQAMRELGRDARNLALAPRAELMLYLTREVQLLEEATRPALARADVVIADRFVATAEALAVYGRGLPEADVTAMVAAATGGFRPDLTVLVDVDPTIARARRQVAKLVAREKKPPSRKGLAGTALQRRLREGYRAIAARDGWLIVDNTDAELDALADALAERIASQAHVALPAAAARPAAHDRASARAALLAWIDERAGREPHLAAYFLDGLNHDPEIDARRRALADAAPAVIAAGLKWLDDPVSWELRERLAERAPGEVARSIVGPGALASHAHALLRALVARAPQQVGETLAGRDDALAWELRGELPLDAIVASLARVLSERAWPLREHWLAQPVTDVARATLGCAMITGLGDDRAWAVREALQPLAPVAALESLGQLADDDRAWQWRTRGLERAPKIVMKTLALVTDDRAWELRERVAAHCEEALDSIVELDHPRAWQLREGALDRWPASVVKSLGALALGERGQALVDAALARHPTNIALWRQVVMVDRPRRR